MFDVFGTFFPNDECRLSGDGKGGTVASQKPDSQQAGCLPVILWELPNYAIDWQAVLVDMKP